MNSNVSGWGAEEEVKKALQFLAINSAVTLEPRHENKNCSACLKDQLKPI